MRLSSWSRTLSTHSPKLGKPDAVIVNGPEPSPRTRPQGHEPRGKIVATQSQCAVWRLYLQCCSPTCKVNKNTRVDTHTHKHARSHTRTHTHDCERMSVIACRSYFVVESRTRIWRVDDNFLQECVAAVHQLGSAAVGNTLGVA